jgi:hypothetical protein
VSTGRSIHAVPSITPSPREGIEDPPLRPEARSGVRPSRWPRSRTHGPQRERWGNRLERGLADRDADHVRAASPSIYSTWPFFVFTPQRSPENREPLATSVSQVGQTRWIPTRSATPATALVPQRKVGFPIPNAGLLLGFRGTKTARREGISSRFSDAGGCTSPQNSGHAVVIARNGKQHAHRRCAERPHRPTRIPRALRPEPERTLVASDRIARIDV